MKIYGWKEVRSMVAAQDDSSVKPIKTCELAWFGGALCQQVIMLAGRGDKLWVRLPSFPLGADVEDHRGARGDRDGGRAAWISGD